MKRLLCLLFLLLAYAKSEAADLSFTINAEALSVSVGLPIILNLQLSSAQNFALDNGFGCDGHTELIVKDDSGNTAAYAMETPCPEASRSPFDSKHKIIFDGVANSSYEVYLLPGKYLISAKYKSLGPYLDRYSATDQRPVEGIWIGELTSNTLAITVYLSDGEDSKAFLNLGPPAKELDSPQDVVWFLKTNWEKILSDYPKSSYTAWIRWKLGLDRYNNEAVGMTHLSTDEQLNYSEYLHTLENGVSPGNAEFLKKLHQQIIDAWGPLNVDFPNFSHRSFVLQGLAQTYVHLGEFNKAIPLIKELLEKYPETDEAKKVTEYKAWMQQKNIWN